MVFKCKRIQTDIKTGTDYVKRQIKITKTLAKKNLVISLIHNKIAEVPIYDQPEVYIVSGERRMA